MTSFLLVTTCIFFPALSTDVYSKTHVKGLFKRADYLHFSGNVIIKAEHFMTLFSKSML